MKAAEVTTVDENGFRGFFYRTDAPSDRCVIVAAGDKGNDFLSRACARWLTGVRKCHALCIAAEQQEGDDSGFHSWPLEYIESGVHWLMEKGMAKVGILGVSMQASLALTAASLIPELSLVMALMPSDFVPWGFFQGKMDGGGKGEWPSGTSAFSWRGADLPYQPAYLEKEAYWGLYCEEKQQHGEPHSITVFEQSEARSPIPEEAMIRVENIRGTIVLVGAEDDAMWNTSRYIRRMVHRLEEKRFQYPVEVCIYTHGTHLLVPEELLRGAVPLVGDVIPRTVFKGAKLYPDACRQAREDVEARLREAMENW